MKSTSVVRDFPLVCVGGSAGGLDAYIRLLSHLPASMGVAVVIVNHLRTVATQLHEVLPRYMALRGIKDVGGISIAQKLETAKQPDMPEIAIASGGIYFILSPEDIAHEIVRIARGCTIQFVAPVAFDGNI